MARGEDTRDHEGRRVGRHLLENTADFMRRPVGPVGKQLFRAGMGAAIGNVIGGPGLAAASAVGNVAFQSYMDHQNNTNDNDDEEYE